MTLRLEYAKSNTKMQKHSVNSSTNINNNNSISLKNGHLNYFSPPNSQTESVMQSNPPSTTAGQVFFPTPVRGDGTMMGTSFSPTSPTTCKQKNSFGGTRETSTPNIHTSYAAIPVSSFAPTSPVAISHPQQPIIAQYHHGKNQ